MPSQEFNGSSEGDGLAAVALAQGIYYVITGFWPVMDIKTFQLITGRKRDLWLVKTTGALIGVIGVILVLARSEKRVSREARLLGVGSALALGAADINYSVRRVVSWVYFLDGLAEMGFVILWLLRPSVRGLRK